MRVKKQIGLTLLIAFFLFNPSAFGATDYHLQAWLLNALGKTEQNHTYSLGEPCIGVTTSGNYIHQSGFLYALTFPPPDTTPPTPPTINPVTSPTAINSQTINGTKSADTTTIIVTCPTATVGTVTYPIATGWSCLLSNLSAGSNNITVQAKDAAGNTSTSATTSIVYNRSPQVGTITSSSGASNPNQAVSFTTTYLDPDGWPNIQYVHLLINATVNGANCFYGYYNQNENKLYLRNDANAAWLGGFAPGSSNTIENSYAKLDSSQTTVSGSGTTLTVKWSLTFKSTFSGVENTYLYVKDDTNVASGWVQKGDFCIFRKPIAPPN